MPAAGAAAVHELVAPLWREVDRCNRDSAAYSAAM